jgi:hypothetical protein
MWASFKVRRCGAFGLITIAALLSGAVPRVANSAEVIDNIRDIARQLQTCWIAPPLGQRNGVIFSVRVSFRGNGDVLGRPFVYFQTRDVSRQEREQYQGAVTDMFRRCGPLHFSTRLAAGIAGHPVLLHIIEGEGRSFQM